MRYRIITCQTNGKEQIKKINQGKKHLYQVQDQANGKVYLVDRKWLIIHKPQVSNLGISNNNYYLVVDRYDKAMITALSELLSIMCHKELLPLEDEYSIFTSELPSGVVANKKLTAYRELRNYGPEAFKSLIDKLLKESEVCIIKQHINGKEQLVVRWIKDCTDPDIVKVRW